ncbi:MAG: hypothetical protein WDN10_03315 [bacterium]
MKQKRVGVFVAALMCGLAALFDLIQFFLFFLNSIPVVGNAVAFIGSWFVAIFAGIVFYLVWFPLLGIKMTKGKSAKLLNLLGSAVLEATPLLNSLPGVTYGVISTIIISRTEDAAYNAAHAAEIKAKEAERRRADAYARGAAEMRAAAANDNEETTESAQEAA